MNIITETSKGDTSAKTKDNIDSYLEKVYEPNLRKLLYRCYQCVRCSGVCQLSKVQTFEPSRIIQMILEGFENKVIESGILLDCLTCNACLQNCPEGINFADIVRMAKYKKVSEDCLIPSFIEIATNIQDNTEEKDGVTLNLRSIKSAVINDIIFKPIRPRGFKHIYKVVNGKWIEEPQ